MWQCGKGEDTSCNLKACTACKMVKYCNRECQIAHRPQHKKECKKRAKELHDEKLFKQVETEDCPICLLRMPFLPTGRKYMSCCGKEICSGCTYAPVYDNEGNEVGNEKCPFCRTPYPNSDEEGIARKKKIAEAGYNAHAIYKMGSYYHQGSDGFPQDYGKALELWHRAGKLGYSKSFYNIGICYYNGRGVELDKKKANHYLELASMEGDVHARYNLGLIEVVNGNWKRAMKHYMIAVGGGDAKSLERIKEFFVEGEGYATKDGYTKALRSYQAYLSEIKSAQRDEAAAASQENRYY